MFQLNSYDKHLIDKISGDFFSSTDKWEDLHIWRRQQTTHHLLHSTWHNLSLLLFLDRPLKSLQWSRKFHLNFYKIQSTDKVFNQFLTVARVGKIVCWKT